MEVVELKIAEEKILFIEEEEWIQNMMEILIMGKNIQITGIFFNVAMPFLDSGKV